MKIVITLDFGDAKPTSISVGDEGAPIVSGGTQAPEETEVPKGKRARPAKSAPTTDVPAPEAAPAPATEAPKASAIFPSKNDLRAALVKLQSVKGKQTAVDILAKHASPATIDGCPEDKRATVIAECQRAAA